MVVGGGGEDGGRGRRGRAHLLREGEVFLLEDPVHAARGRDLRDVERAGECGDDEGSGGRGLAHPAVTPRASESEGGEGGEAGVRGGQELHVVPDPRGEAEEIGEDEESDEGRGEPGAHRRPRALAIPAMTSGRKRPAFISQYRSGLAAPPSKPGCQAKKLAVESELRVAMKRMAGAARGRTPRMKAGRTRASVRAASISAQKQRTAKEWE